MTRQYCHVGSRTIAYLDSAPGARDLRAVVLLHAFPLGASMWEPQLRSVPKGWRLITPDLRGFGGSTSDNGTPTMDDYAVDVMGLLGELGVGRAVVGGCSMGGYATFALLKRARTSRSESCSRTPGWGPIRRRDERTAGACWRWSIAKAPRASRAT